MAFVLSTEILSNCMSNTHAQKVIFQNINPRMDKKQNINKSHTALSQRLETRIMNLDNNLHRKLVVTQVFNGLFSFWQCSKHRSKTNAGPKVQTKYTCDYFICLITHLSWFLFPQCDDPFLHILTNLALTKLNIVNGTQPQSITLMYTH